MSKERVRIVVSDDHKWYRLTDTMRVATDFGSERMFDLWFPVVGGAGEVDDRLIDSVQAVMVRHGIASDDPMEFHLPCSVPDDTGFSFTVIYTED
jgi:hypothetical protein